MAPCTRSQTRFLASQPLPGTISSLPNELLTEIFQHVFDSASVYEWYQQILTPLRLVSPHWNAVIENSSSLWTSILLTEKSLPVVLDPADWPLITLLSRLDRSRNLPLHITIDLSILPDPDFFDKEQARQLGRHVRSQAARLVSFKLRSKSRILTMGVLSRLNKTPMPKLRSFTLIGWEDPAVGVAETYTPFIEAGGFHNMDAALLQRPGELVSRTALNAWGKELYPALEEMEIVGVKIQYPRLPIMSTIRRLCIRGVPRQRRPPPHMLWEMLSSVRQSLEVLELEDVVIRGSCLQFPPVFEKLLVFKLGYENPYEVTNFLYSLRMPALLELGLTYTSANRTSFDPKLRDHRAVLRILVQHLPLHQVKRLFLNGVVLSNSKPNIVNIPRSTDGLSDAWIRYYSEELKLGDKEKFSPVCGHWRLPTYVIFLFRFSALEYLSLNDVRSENPDEDPKKVLGFLWREGSLPTLTAIHVDGSAAVDGLFFFLQSVNLYRLFFDRRPMKITIGAKLRDALAEQQKTDLNYWRSRLLQTTFVRSF